MRAVGTVQVYWPAKFGKRLVTINAGDFDPALHRYEPVIEAEVETSVNAVEPTPAPKSKGRPKKQ